MTDQNLEGPMQDGPRTLKQLPWLKTSDGTIRRVGVELEITGLTLDALAGCVAGFFDLRVEEDGRYERRMKGDAAGDWIVEFDFDLLKRLGHETYPENSIRGDVEQAAEDVLALTAKSLVPLEIVSPPLPLTRLDEVEALIVHLRDAGVKGTSDSAVNAFGMQFNPELPSLGAPCITVCLQAFLCLYDWLLARADIDLSRRITSYVDPFPRDYVLKVIAPDYRPDINTLIDDYLADNPTRNRALDMLPLFKFIDEDRVTRTTDDTLIKARPTFHYRLPDCDIHKPDWGLYVSWNDWAEVERLAADEERLKACCAAYLDSLQNPLKRLFGDWTTAVEKQWLAR